MHPYLGASGGECEAHGALLQATSLELATRALGAHDRGQDTAAFEVGAHRGGKIENGLAQVPVKAVPARDREQPTHILERKIGEKRPLHRLRGSGTARAFATCGSGAARPRSWSATRPVP